MVGLMVGVILIRKERFGAAVLSGFGGFFAGVLL
jgi:hypothetical protein